MAEDPEFEGLPVALLRLDLDGRVTGANALARGLLRMGEEANLLVAELLVLLLVIYVPALSLTVPNLFGFSR